MRGRAFRRHQARLAKRRAYNYLHYVWGLDEPTPAHVGIFAGTHCCPCSCDGCGNMRRLYGPSWPERRMTFSEKEQRREAGVR